MRKREEAAPPLQPMAPRLRPLSRHGPASVAVALVEATTDRRNPQDKGERGGGDWLTGGLGDEVLGRTEVTC